MLDSAPPDQLQVAIGALVRIAKLSSSDADRATAREALQALGVDPAYATLRQMPATGLTPRAIRERIHS